MSEALALIPRQEVERITGLSRSAIYRKMAAGTFPLPYRASENGRAVRWLRSEVDAYVQQRVDATLAERRAGRRLPNAPPRRKQSQQQRSRKYIAVVCVKGDGKRSLFGRYASTVDAKTAATALNKNGLRAEIRDDVNPDIRIGQKVPSNLSRLTREAQS